MKFGKISALVRKFSAKKTYCPGFKNRCCLGYSLVELSITTSIMAMLAVGGLAILHKKNAADKEKITRERLSEIDNSIKKFIKIKQYLPCPALPTLQESSVNFGKSEDLRDGSGDLLSPSTIYNTTNQDCSSNGLTNNTGMAPVRTLGLADHYAYDGWERKFTYRIAPGTGKKEDFTRPSTKGTISVIDLDGNEKTTINDTGEYGQGAIYVVLSHGSNGNIGNAAWRKNYDYTNNSDQLPNYQNVGGLEAQNVNHTTKTYIQDDISGEFDDMLIFGMKNSVVKPKTYQAPFAFDDNTCNTAGELSKLSGLATFSTNNSGTHSSLAKHVYKSAEIVKQICNNPPPPIPSACKSAGIKCTDMTLWLDANDTSTLYVNPDCTSGGSNSSTFISNGTTIGCWKDKSGNGIDLIQGTSAVRPIYKTSIQNSKAVMSFDGTDDYMATASAITGGKLASADQITIFAVYVDKSPSTATAILSWMGASSSRINIHGLYSNSFYWDFGTNTYDRIYFTPSGFLDNWYLVTTIKRPDDTMEIWFNGVSKLTGSSKNKDLTTSNTATFYIAKYENGAVLKTDIGEIIIYKIALTDTQRAAVRSYLTTKWGL